MKKNFKLLIIFIAFLILLIITVILILNKRNFNIKNTSKADKQNISKKIKGFGNNNANSLIPLKLGSTKKVTGGEFLSINNYKIIIPEELVKIGYNIGLENNVLTITAIDKSYKCVLLQLSDNYIMPTEEEIDKLYETVEYKEWDKEDYDYNNDDSNNLHWEKYNKITTDYFKKLGYKAKNSPNYVLTNKEMKSIVGKYILEGESNSSGSNGLFPGYEYYAYYSWGKNTTYAIPKYEKDDKFGEMTSNLSIYLIMFEYYNKSEVYFNIELSKY